MWSCPAASSHLAPVACGGYRPRSHEPKATASALQAPDKGLWRGTLQGGGLAGEGAPAFPWAASTASWLVEVKSLKGMPSGLLLASGPVHSGICTYKGINRHASNSYFVVGAVLGSGVAMETRSTRSQASGSSRRCGFHALPSVIHVESLNFWGSVVCRAHWESL